MTIIEDISQFPYSGATVVTVGMFDGLHKGHQYVLQQLITAAHQKKMKSVLVTFEPHPKIVLAPYHVPVQLLTSKQEKIALLQQMPLDFLVIIPFTIELSRLSAMEFIRDYLIAKLSMAHLMIGYDHRIGRNREGDYREIYHLSEVLGFSLEQLQPQEIDGIRISSTKIRKMLTEGHPDQAEKYLGRPYSLMGRVIEGDKRGKQLGFPTANIQPEDPHKLLPRYGVYLVKVHIGKNIYYGLSNIGIKPTFGKKDPSVEVHLFDFNENIYGDWITIEFIKFMREEKTFASIEELQLQVSKDVQEAKNILVYREHMGHYRN